MQPGLDRRNQPRSLVAPTHRVDHAWPAMRRSHQAWPEACLGPSAGGHAGALRDSLLAFVAQADFPCVAAKSALNRQRYRFGTFDALGSAINAAALCSALYEFGREFGADAADNEVQPATFMAIFAGAGGCEESFERRLWQQLRCMHEVDRRHFAWDDSVSSDPVSTDFSYSVGGRAYFIVGMHPRAERLARRAPVTALVFNLHSQFQKLKADGRYDQLQRSIRARELALQGSINPNLANFGQSSEARQYAGRAVPRVWVCPFAAGESTLN